MIDASKNTNMVIAKSKEIQTSSAELKKSTRDLARQQFSNLDSQGSLRLLHEPLLKKLETSIQQILDVSRLNNQSLLLGLYFPLRDEIDWRSPQFLQWISSGDLQVSFPVIDAQSKVMTYHFVGTDKFKELEFSSRKIELNHKELAESEPSVPDTLLVPALSFSKCGYRLGRGGGFFDRYLAKYPSVQSIGLCYEDLLIERLLEQSSVDHPIDMTEMFEGHDQKINQLITNLNIYNCRQTEPANSGADGR